MYKIKSYNVSEILNLSMIFILYYLLHMKMKKLLVGVFLWMFALAWVAVLPNYAKADSGTTYGWFEGDGAQWRDEQEHGSPCQYADR